jgi:hypothetical protein
LLAPDLANGQASASSLADSLSFEQRLDNYRQSQHPRPPRLATFDSLVTYFASERFNVGKARQRSFYHGAGDYFKFDPAYFVTDYQVTPMRTTVQPFGVGGNRLNLVVNGMEVSPFEHTIQPDGMVDLNDLPTAFDRDIFLLPGAVGLLFGGHQTLATLVTTPGRLDGNLPQTNLLAEEGSLGWSWVRGRYARRFLSGREAVMSIGYRGADGPIVGRGDDAYHGLADFYFPVGSAWGLQASGQLYDRNGRLVIEPEIGGASVQRDRFDRYGQVVLDRHNKAFDSRLAIGYRHRRQGSFLNGPYQARYNYTGNSGFFRTEKLFGRVLSSAELSVEHLEYDNFRYDFRRTAGDASLTLARLASGLRWALTAGSRFDDEFRFQPRAALVVSRDTDRSLVQVSAGYSERAPSLHEQYLYLHTAEIYGSGADDYADNGNLDLRTERQFTGSLVYEYGSQSSALRLQLTAGRITDGIDWRRSNFESDTADYVVYQPRNADIEFMDVSVSERLQWRQWLNLCGGASLHQVKDDTLDQAYYAPEFQAFSGMELRLPWASRRVDIYGYGELAYVGPYDGYDDRELGGAVVANTKLTLATNNFRFFLVWQNLTGQAYRLRDYHTTRDIFFYYGLTWNFLD